MRRTWTLQMAAVLFAVDMIVKQYVEDTLDAGTQKDLGDTGLVLRKIYNEGFMLNFLDQYPKVVKNVTIASGVSVLAEDICWFSRKGHWTEKAGMTLVSAGAASNIFDRLVRGRVVDYIGWKSGPGRLADVTANLGDTYLAAGMLVMAGTKLLEPRCKKK